MTATDLPVYTVVKQRKSKRTLACFLQGRPTHMDLIKGSLCLAHGWLWPTGAQQEIRGRAGKAVRMASAGRHCPT